MTIPVLPYAGTSGWSGSEASRDRALTQDGDGTTATRQERVVAVLTRAGTNGVTWKELADRMGMHHGQASGVLSVLHKEGLIARLVERRNRCSIYVVPECVGDRSTAPHGPTRASSAVLADVRAVCEALPDGPVSGAAVRAVLVALVDKHGGESS